MIVPGPERIPLPDTEPVPAQEPYEDQRAGELAVGSYGAVIWRDKAVRRKKPKFPVGFRAVGT